MEFSKKAVYFSWAVTLFLTALTIMFSVFYLPVDGLIEVTRLAWAATGTTVGFYLWKAKNENRAKYGQQFLNDFAEKYSADVAVRMAEIVLKD